MNITNQVAVTLDDDSIELLDKLHAITKMNPGEIIAKLFPAHLEELWTYLAWLEQLPAVPSNLRTMGANLIHNYGPSTLIQNVKALDPNYRTEGERFGASLTQKGTQ